MPWDVRTLVFEALGWRPTQTRALVESDGQGVYEVDGQDGPLIAKVNADPAALLREIEIQTQAGAAGVPVAPIVAVRPGPPAVAVMAKVAGSPLSSAALRAAEDAGRHLRTLHALGATTVATEDRRWGGRVASVAGRHLAYLRRERILAPSDADRLGALFAANVDALDARPLALLHGDLHPGHVLVDGNGDGDGDGDGDGPTVRAFLDFADARPGDPALDLAVLTADDETLLEPVLAGYGAGGDERAALLEMLPVYRLLCHIGTIQVCHSHGRPSQASLAAVRAVASEGDEALGLGPRTRYAPPVLGQPVPRR